MHSKNFGSANQITRRGFLELGSVALATAGLGVNGKADTLPNPETVSTEAPTAVDKIALEEHFTLREIIEDSYAVKDLPPETRFKILDLGSGRLADMDQGGLELCVLSLTARKAGSTG